ncbi:MBL fold metallo-hydrolase [Cohaesibacter sp. CAU 1516]|uniref:MBL fold metallo-hydrolase n=1 Tax=Cohaesibacter sp. CAU 1516 TaxID=2576038 RepID=UPI0010FE5FEE|nr:MBL fold metallo-hydrolase [Cohaesibacter sp. CAU 1516]TLP45016.1 MBL fold metallo-hydrolase [Cohaesibacter sp. CAU 1516]
MAPLHFNRDFTPDYGQAIKLSSGVRRVTCNNPGPFTYLGTNSYIIGEGDVAILDPGPADEAHIKALLRATEGETISHILISHTHVDHSPGAALLQRHCGAPIYAEGPHRPARALHLGEMNPLDASADLDLQIDHRVGDGDRINGKDWSLEVLHTPGHTTNHLSFAFTDGSGMFSADHVMAWSTSIVAPPDGSMAEFMDSLEKLMGRNDAVYWPGHGGVLHDPAPFLVGLKEHRLAREQALIDRLHAGDETIPAMVATVYKDTDPSLHGAASLSMFAQMEYLVERGRVRCLDAVPSLRARFKLIG